MNKKNLFNYKKSKWKNVIDEIQNLKMEVKYLVY